MEQLDQLRTMRDEAAIRLDLARAALERSPDAKLVNSLSSLITDLETSLGITAPAANSKTVSMENAFQKSTVKEPVKEPVKEEAKVEVSADDMAQAMDDELASEDFGSELSLEESLEAELLASDEYGKSGSKR